MGNVSEKLDLKYRIKNFDIDDPFWFSLVMKTSALLMWMSVCFVSVFYTIVPFIELPVLPLEVSLFVQVFGMTLFGVAMYKLIVMYKDRKRGVE